MVVSLPAEVYAEIEFLVAKDASLRLGRRHDDIRVEDRRWNGSSALVSAVCNLRFSLDIVLNPVEKSLETWDVSGVQFLELI